VEAFFWLYLSGNDMSTQIIQTDEFVMLSSIHPVLDVRSPAEYNHAHIPGARSLPLFTDAERAQIGTAYKQMSREAAIRIGLGAFGPRMNEMIGRVEEITKQHLPQHNGPGESRVLVHCWRGGMRSAAVAWLLDLYGFKVHVLEGGYKAYRNWALRRMDIPYNLKVVGGNTGAGKTIVLHELHKKGYSVLDLEHLAGHKGSAFGGLGGHVQPGQEQFENALADRLYKLTIKDAGVEIYVEDESQRIGAVNLPSGFFELLTQSPQYFLDVPFEARLDHILKEYGQFSVESLINAIVRIKKRLGPLETKTAVNFLIEGDRRACFAILLTYYDKQYLKSLQARGTAAGPLRRINCLAADAAANTQSLIQLMEVHASS
jgi:tRNA 2-selenouridine synthase